MRNKLNWCLGDVLVSVVLVTLIGTAGLVASQRARDTANRAKCASNQHQIGLAILLYQNDNQQSFPRTLMDATADHKPTWGTPYSKEKNPAPVDGANAFNGKTETPAPNDVTAALYLLLTNERISSSVFVCPSARLKGFDFGGGAGNETDWTNWPGDDGIAKHLSYAYQNPYVSDAAVTAGYNFKNPDATFVVLGDIGPGGDAELNVTPKSTEQQMQAANSLNHGREGQNLLFGDGHVEWQTTPFAGSQHDNVYTAAGPEIQEPGRGKAILNASSVSGTDSVLMPNSADIHAEPPKPAVPLTAAALDKLKAGVRGRFLSDGLKQGAVLTIDEKTIKITDGPVTVLFSYTVTGGEENALTLKLTGADTDEHGVIRLDGDTLELRDDFGYSNFGRGWKRTAAAAEQPAK